MWYKFCSFLRRIFNPSPDRYRVVERICVPGSGIIISHRPEIRILSSDDEKFWLHLTECPEEISGLALATYDAKANTLTISDLTLLEQKVSRVETDLDQTAIGKLMTDMITDGKDTGLLKVWWHSHVTSDVYWSQHQDEVTIQSLKHFGFDFLISIVGNVHGERLCRLDIFEPIHVTLDNVPIRIIHPTNPELRRQIRIDIGEKVELSGGGL